MVRTLSKQFVKLLTVAFLSVAALVTPAQVSDPCVAFQKTINETYNFRPALLANETERKKKSAAMDRVWEVVKSNKAELLPCLKRALEQQDADSWFRFDGSNLLVSVDPSDSSKKIQIRNYTNANLDDVDLRVWVSTLARRGFEGYDVSDAAERWLLHPKARYFLPEHGGFEIDTATGALILFGSMDENLALPALLKIVNQPTHAGRDTALAILLNLNTPESLDALSRLNLETLSSKARDAVRKELTHPDLFEPRAKPRTTRKEFVDAFQAFLNGDVNEFLDLASKVPDGERDVVATLTQDDLPLLRKMRRNMIARGNQHTIEFYVSFTKIIGTIVHTKGAPRVS